MKTLHIDELVDGQRIGGFTLNVVFWSFLAMFSDGYEINAMSLAAPELRALWHLPAASFTWALSAAAAWMRQGGRGPARIARPRVPGST
jgi:fermentation-respiration switch protein FrsA (DUF1100 family)